MAARLDKDELYLRRIGLPLALCAAIFATASYSISFLQVAQGISGFWLPNGLALVALLRSPRREWPMLVIAALAGNVAAGLIAQNSSATFVLIRSGVSAVQYCLCAYVLRRRLGEYFDLLEPSHLIWLGAVGAVTTVLKIALQIGLLDLIPQGSTMSWLELLTWSFNNYLGLFVLSLPLLAITARSAYQSAKWDGIGIALLVCLIGELALIFGPASFPGLYILMPVLMLLAWRHGLFGAGVGTLITVLVVSAFSIYGSGLQSTLIAAGYSAVERGTHMEMFCSVTILTSLPLAVARARQLAMDAALIANENRWRAALEGSGLGVWDWNIPGETVYFSKVWKAMHGFGEDEIGNNFEEWSDRIHPEDQASALAAVEDHLRGDQPTYQDEYRLLGKGGAYKWILSRGMVFEHTPAGTPLRMVGTNTDIDAIKQASERAERHGRLYIALAACNVALARRDSIENVGATICEILVTSGKMRMAWVALVDPESGLFEPLSLYSADDVDYMAGIVVSARADHPNGQGAMGRAFREDQPLWVDDFTDDDRSLSLGERALSLGWRGAAALPLRRRGKPVGVLSMYTDEVGFFDENARALLNDMASQFNLALDTLDAEESARTSEAALVANENRWRAALEGSGLGVWDWNIAGKTAYYSKVWADIRGFAEDEITNVETGWQSRVHPDDVADTTTAIAAHLDGATPIYEHEHRVLCKDGHYKWVLDRGTVVERAPGGKPMRMIGTNTDIDARKQAGARAERHANLYIALAACNAALARRGSFEQLVARICEILVTSGGMKLAWVGLANRETGLFDVVSYFAERRDVQYLVGVEISWRADDPRGLGPMGGAFRDNQPVWIDDLSIDDRNPNWRERAASHGWRGSASLPLRRKGEPVAILSLYTDEPGYFDENARALLNDMAAQFSLALDALDAEDTAHQFRESLSMSEQRFRAMFEASPFGIALMDTGAGNFLTVNATYETIVGWTSEELLGKTWQDITHPDDLNGDWELASQFFAGAIPGYQFEKRYIRKGGEPVWVNMTIARFVFPGADSQQHLCMIEDITERKALEHQIHFVQQMESIGQLTGGVAHDFNNLLTIVIGSSETLADQVADPGQRKLANLILQAAEQGSELIRRLLAFARRQPLEPHPYDVNELLDSMARLIKRTLGANLQFSIETGAGLRPAFADPAQTESAILNLCLNARDAMPHGGKLTIRTENVTLGEDYVRRHPDALPGDYSAIRVSDTGTGIAPDVIEHIFEPFFTTKETGKGSGLGLSMIYGFIQQSKGYLDLSSELGKGTTFSLYLPVADADAPTVALPSPVVEAIEGGSENVLIVEDNDLVREHVRVQFESLGYQVTVASTGAEALAVLATKDDIDLLFTDVVMPGGMNGRQLAETAVERWPWLRVLYTSGYSRDALTQDGRLLDDVTLLSKPYSKRELSEKARKVLDEVP